MLRLRITAFVLGVVAPLATWAVCTCGFGDGQFTLATISIDGDTADWAPVHADLDNNVCDGVSGDASERDGNIQSTGRDLTHLAYTWDSSNVYLFTERAGSQSNVQSFAYYADIDNDGLMETGEPVIGVTWRGSNRNVDVYVFTYVADAPGGDPMVDTNGFGDGYTLPGSFAGVPSQPNRSGAWGSSDGYQMEFWITWAELGLPPDSPFTFHVSSSNAPLGAASFASQVDDNLSGCGGGLGSTTFASLTFSPDLFLTGFAGQTIVGVHTLTNAGNDVDSFDLASASGGDFAPTIGLYADSDGSGSLTAGDIQLTDTNGNGIPDTGALAAGASMTILVAYEIPAGAASGSNAAVTTTASSFHESQVTAAVVDSIDVVPGPDIVVSKSVTVLNDPVNLGVNPLAIPGGVVLYTVTVRNEGDGSVDADTVEILDVIPADGCMLLADLGGPGEGPVAFADGSPASGLSYSFAGLADDADDLEFSSDGGANFDYDPSVGSNGCDSLITHIRINPKGVFAADTGSGAPSAEFSFRMLIR